MGYQRSVGGEIKHGLDFKERHIERDLLRRQRSLDCSRPLAIWLYYAISHQSVTHKEIICSIITLFIVVGDDPVDDYKLVTPSSHQLSTQFLRKCNFRW